jgi:hypothetical protein
MKKTILYFLVFVLSQACLASSDSIRVEICLDTNTMNCFGFNSYYRQVYHYQQGLLTEQNSYRFSGCTPVQVDTMLVHESDVFFTYDSLSRLTITDIINYGDITYEVKIGDAYDSLGNKTSNSIYQGIPGSLDLTHQATITYDSLNRLTSDIQLDWNTSTATLDTNTFRSVYYTTVTSFDVRRTFNTQTQTFDTNYYSFITLDSLGRMIENVIRYFNPPQEYYTKLSYDASGNVIFELSANTYNGVTDSTRYLKSYTATNKILEIIRQQYDTVLFQWTFIKRLYYTYNGIDSMLKSFQFICPDTMCSDTIDILTYLYNASNQLTEIIDSSFDTSSQSWNVYWPFINTYDQFGRLIGTSENEPPDHCSRHEHHHYVYNSANEITFSLSAISTCDQSNTGCWYYNLTGDSMLVQLFYPFGICQGDTIYPAVTALGGTPSYTIQWTPSNMILNPSLDSAAIVADTIPYVLRVTDSLGFSQSDTLRLNINCFITSASQIDNAGNISVYPNPFNDVTVIQLQNTEQRTRFDLYDINGKKLREGESKSSRLILKKNDLKPGMYFVKIFSEDKFEGVVRIIAE